LLYAQLGERPRRSRVRWAEQDRDDRWRGAGCRAFSADARRYRSRAALAPRRASCCGSGAALAAGERVHPRLGARRRQQRWGPGRRLPADDHLHLHTGRAVQVQLPERCLRRRLQRSHDVRGLLHRRQLPDDLQRERRLQTDLHRGRAVRAPVQRRGGVQPDLLIQPVHLRRLLSSESCRSARARSAVLASAHTMPGSRR
jgi:hypothetical protein